MQFIKIANSQFYQEKGSGGGKDESLPDKKGDPGRPIISIMIGPHEFDNVVYDLGASINVIPKAIYDNVLQFGPLLRTTMRIRFAD